MMLAPPQVSGPPHTECPALQIDEQIAARGTAGQKRRREERLRVKTNLLKGPIGLAAQASHVVPPIAVDHWISLSSLMDVPHSTSTALSTFPLQQMPCLFPMALVCQERMGSMGMAYARHRGIPRCTMIQTWATTLSMGFSTWSTACYKAARGRRHIPHSGTHAVLTPRAALLTMLAP